MSLNGEEEHWMGFEYHWRVNRAEMDQKHFRHKIESPVFATVNNGLQYLWSLFVYPKGDMNGDFPSADKQPNISLYLKLKKGSVNENVKAKYQFFILGNAGITKHRTFSVSGPRFGWISFCQQKKIEAVEWVVLGAKIWLKPSAFDVHRLFPNPQFQNIHKNRLLYQQIVLGDKSQGSATGDIAILVKKQKLPCHQLFLQNSSPVFQAMFRRPWAEGKTQEVCINDVPLKTLKQLLFYFYVDGMPEGWEENVLSLLRAAHKYDVQAVVRMCEKELAKDLSVESAVELLPMAKKMDLELLGMRAVQVLVDNWDQVSPADRKKLRQSDAILEVTDAAASQKNVTCFGI